MKKRGQITLFIILGILILFAVFAFFYIRAAVVKEEIIEEIPVVVKVPLEFEPIRLFTQECLEKVGTEGLKILGEQGGYIDLEESGISVSSTDPTEADALEFAPDSGLNVPYWWYLRAPNDCAGNCLFTSLRPNLHRTSPEDGSVEAQLDSYIEREIKRCLNNYRSFEIQGFEFDIKEELKVNSRVTENNVLLTLIYPMEVKLGDKKSDIEFFYATIPVNFKRIYEFATAVTNSEIEHKFLEKQALDLIVAFSGLDTNKLPPMSRATFELGPGIIWIRSNVKENIQEMLMVYVSAFQIYNTRNFRKRYMVDPIMTAIYEAFELPINLTADYSDLDATFTYLGWWPIYFDINSEGELIQPDSFVNNLPQIFSFGFQNYNAVYDLSYPVVVELKDPSALRGEGYIFRFALESNFRNNEVLDGKFQGLTGIILFEESLLCNQNQRNSGDVAIRIIDAAAEEPIPDVAIGFKCGEESCAIGSTDNKGMLIAKFPVCFGGLLGLTHSDYFTPTLYLSTLFNRSVQVPTIKLYPYIDKEVVVSKYMLSDGQLGINALPLGNDEEAMIRFERQIEFVGEKRNIGVIKYFGNQTDKSIVRFVPGTYEIKGDLLLHRPVIIPEDERKEGNWPFQEEYTIPEVVINDSYMPGGIILDSQTGYFVLDADQLYRNNTLHFYLIGLGLPTKVEELNNPDKMRSISSRFRARLEPEFE